MENLMTENLMDDVSFVMPTQVIGCGACGGKIVKDLIDYNIIPINKCMIINSTDQDRPDTPATFINIGRTDQLGGCAKEPSRGYELCKEAIADGRLDLDKFILPDTKKIYVITSLEGGTGCGSSKLIVPYLSNVAGLPVHLIAISGFEEDPRGIKNTVQFMKELTDDITVSIICNKKYLKAANGDKLKAEKMCNKDIINLISILDGNIIIPSDKNIDSNDLLKLSTRTGYLNICSRDLDDKIRNVDQFNAILKDMIDNSTSMDVRSPKQTAMGVFINLPPDEQINIDYSFSVIKEYYNADDSESFDNFTHVQYDPEIANSISFINAGMQLPLDEMQRMYDLFTILDKKSKSVQKDKQKFFEAADTMIFEDEDDYNNLSSKPTMSKNDFLASLGKGKVNNNNISNKGNNKLDEF